MCVHLKHGITLIDVKKFKPIFFCDAIGSDWKCDEGENARAYVNGHTAASSSTDPSMTPATKPITVVKGVWAQSKPRLVFPPRL